MCVVHAGSRAIPPWALPRQHPPHAWRDEAAAAADDSRPLDNNLGPAGGEEDLAIGFELFKHTQRPLLPRKALTAPDHHTRWFTAACARDVDSIRVPPRASLVHACRSHGSCRPGDPHWQASV